MQMTERPLKRREPKLVNEGGEQQGSCSPVLTDLQRRWDGSPSTDQASTL